jgi:hypothetical protein
VPDYRVLTAQLDDGRLLVVATLLEGLHDALETVGNVLLIPAVPPDVPGAAAPTEAISTADVHIDGIPQPAGTHAATQNPNH